MNLADAPQREVVMKTSSWVLCCARCSTAAAGGMLTCLLCRWVPKDELQQGSKAMQPCQEAAQLLQGRCLLQAPPASVPQPEQGVQPDGRHVLWAAGVQLGLAADCQHLCSRGVAPIQWRCAGKTTLQAAHGAGLHGVRQHPSAAIQNNGSAGAQW